MAIAALFFLAFAFFAVGQASVTRNGAQTAADAAALAAAREARDGSQAAFLAALKAGDLDKLGQLLQGSGMKNADGCGAAQAYADENHADLGPCDLVADPVGYSVQVKTQGTVGSSVVDGTENLHAQATATAVVEARCVLDGTDGKAVKFICAGRPVTIDPTANDFRLDLSTFYSVHLAS